MINAPKLTRPVGHHDSVFVVSSSGGKDSTALILAMREAEIPCRYVFADTGWEAAQTYAYLADLERILSITIERVSAGMGMVEKIRQRAGFPGRRQRWCTRELKLEPLQAFHDAIRDAEGVDTVSVVGIRAEESQRRSEMLEFEYTDGGTRERRQWDGYTWRPLMQWTVAEVLQIHHRHNVPVNPLYRLGFNRVGCMPCIMSTKADVRLLAEHFPERIDEIRQIELEMTALRATRNADEPGRYSRALASFFQGREETREIDENGVTHRRTSAVTIDQVVEWSKTQRGGRQLPLLKEEPDSGCFRWGFCDAPAPSEPPTDKDAA